MVDDVTRVIGFDIETYAAREAVAPRIEAYFEQRDRKKGIEPGDPRASLNRLSLYPGLAQVVAVGLWSEAARRVTTLALHPGLGVERRELDQGTDRVVFFEREADLLRSFWDRIGAAVERGERLVSFNGRGFDGPILLVRSSVLGVAPTVDLARRGLRPHCDLDQVFSFFGAYRQHLSLDYWCHVYDVASPKAGMNGGDVAGAYERREYAAIAEYALRDARATAEIFAKIAPTLIPLLEGKASSTIGA